MRIATLRTGNREQAALLEGGRLVPVADINARLGRAWPTDVFGLIAAGLSPALLEDDAARTPGGIDPADATFGPLYRHPRKIWGIGLNYRDHAADLNAPNPTEPASFMKGDHTIIGPGDTIVLPPQSERVTAEAELGVIIGRTCKDVPKDRWTDVVAGYCLILDMTAEDILQVNPRFLTRSKNFDTFFSFGPHLVTPDEVPDVPGLTVGTWNNGSLHRANQVRNMAYPPDELVSFHSRVMTLFPGDIISTGTPGAVVIRSGDVAECRIEGMGVLKNPVA